MNSEIKPEIETIDSGVRRVIGQDAFCRHAQFYILDRPYESVALFQFIDYKHPASYEHVTFRAQSNNFGEFKSEHVGVVELIIEAYKQAVELADAWAKDEGKEITNG